ncbi:MAG: hypothetical protein AAF720_13950 [Pseudomonadota bacterium]
MAFCRGLVAFFWTFLWVNPAAAQFKVTDLVSVLGDDIVGGVGLLNSDSDSVAFVATTLVGPKVMVAFNGCDGPANSARCKNVFFYSFFAPTSAATNITSLNALNDAKLITPAYFDKDNDIVLAYWMRSNGPVSLANFRAGFELWHLNLETLANWVRSGGRSTDVNQAQNLSPSIVLSSDTMASSLNQEMVRDLSGAAEINMQFRRKAQTVYKRMQRLSPSEIER